MMTTMWNWLAGRSNKKKPGVRRAAARYRPSLERLEGRDTPAGLVPVASDDIHFFYTKPPTWDPTFSDPNTYNRPSFISGNVLPNDIDPIDGRRSLTAELVAPPTAFSNFSLDADGTYHFQTYLGFVGDDQFTYRAIGPSGKSAPATVFIHITRQDPYAGPPIAQGDAYVLGDAIAMGSNVLTANPLLNDSYLASGTRTVSYGLAQNGVVTATNNGFEYRPNVGYKGIDTFTYVVRDSHGVSNVARIQIIVSAVSLNPVTGQMTTFRPEMPSLGIPAQPVIANGAAVVAGIRINGDAVYEGSPLNENDLVRVELATNLPTLTDAQYTLTRSTGDLRVWDSPLKTKLLLDSNSSTVTLSNNVNVVWVEWATLKHGSSQLTYSVRNPFTGQSRSLGYAAFRTFDSRVIVFTGDTNVPGQSDQSGMRQLALRLYEQGYDVQLVNPGVVSSASNPKPTGATLAFNDVRSAIVDSLIWSVGLIGYGEGGGAVFNVADQLAKDKALTGRFRLDFTTYVDAYQTNASTGSTVAETRRPTNSLYHVDFYERVSGAQSGAATVVTGVGVNTDVNSNPKPMWRGSSSVLNHASIDDDADVRKELVRLIQRSILIQLTTIGPVKG